MTQEWAILKGGEIINVCTTSSRASAQEAADHMVNGPYTVELLDSLPDRVKQAYRYWDERP